MSMTYREIIESNNGDEIIIYRKLDDGSELTATCWTDDPDALDLAASFSVDASWMECGIGRFDNLHGELDGVLGEIAQEIGSRFGCEWTYDAANCAIVQNG